MLGSLKLTPPEGPLALGTDKQRSGRAAVRPRESFVSSTSDRATGRGDTRAGVGDHEGSCHGGLVLSGCGYPAKGGPMAAAATARAPVGTVQVVDPHPLNWLFITWNTMEDSRWIDETTLEVRLRKGVRYQDGEGLSAESFRRAFDEVQRWKAPHPPGTYLNFHPDTRLEVVDAHTVRMRFPQPDGLVLGKFRGFHIPSTRFWEEEGFGYRKRGTGPVGHRTVHPHRGLLVAGGRDRPGAGRPVRLCVAADGPAPQ